MKYTFKMYDLYNLLFLFIKKRVVHDLQRRNVQLYMWDTWQHIRRFSFSVFISYGITSFDSKGLECVWYIQYFELPQKLIYKMKYLIFCEFLCQFLDFVGKVSMYLLAIFVTYLEILVQHWSWPICATQLYIMIWHKTWSN